MAVDFEVVTGNSKTIQIAIRGNGDRPEIVHAYQAITYGVFSGKQVKLVKSLGDGIEIIGGNIVVVRLEPSDTAGLVAGQYNHELQVVTASGDVKTVYQGKFAVKKGLLR